MDKLPANIKELLLKTIDVGCSCDLMAGYICGVHKPALELEAAIITSLEIKHGSST